MNGTELVTSPSTGVLPNSMFRPVDVGYRVVPLENVLLPTFSQYTR